MPRTVQRHLNETRNQINQFGGIEAVAKRLEITETAVYKWLQEDRIPAENAARLFCIARAENLDITFEDLFFYVEEINLLKTGDFEHDTDCEHFA